MIDLDAYFTRIGYTGPHTATLATLRAIHALHPMAIPFENLDPLLGRPVLLDIPSLQAKLVRSARGGYCFEHNVLFMAALERLGFTVAALTGRVLWMLPPDAPPGSRTHMALLVQTEDGPYLADVGFGGSLAAAPIRLVADQEQQTPAARLRLMRDDDAFVLQTDAGGAWRSAYRFTLEPQLPIDLEVGNWFTAAHPSSRFVNGLMAQRLTPYGRVGILNKDLTRRHADGHSERETLDTPERLLAALQDEIGLDVPADAETLFAKLPG